MFRRLRRIPRVVVLASATFAVLLGFWSFLNPVFGPPDEMAHADVVFHLATGADYPEYDERIVGPAAFSLFLTHSMVIQYDAATGTSEAGERTLTSAEDVDFSARFDELGGDESADNWPNQIPQHPPLYYWSSSMGLRAMRVVHGGPLSMDHEVHLLRFLNVLLLAPMPVLAWATARRLGAPDPVATTAALFPLAIPQLAHVGASINHDNLFVALCSALALVLASVLRGDHRARTAVAAGALAGLAMLSKGLGVVLPFWIVACYATPVLRHRDHLRAATRSALIAVGTMVAVGSWFSLRNLLVHGTPSPSLHAATTAPDTFSPDLVAWLAHFPVHLTKGFWGYFGYYEIQIGTAATLLGTILAGTTVASALLGRPRRVGSSTGIGRLELAALLTVIPMLVAFVGLVGWDLYTKTAALRNFVQGRYLFGAVIPLAVGTAVGAMRLFGRWAGAVVLGVALMLQTQSIRLALDRSWGTAGDSLATSYRVVAAWNPWPVPLVHLSAAASVVLFAALAFEVVRRTRQPIVGPPT
jgi:4-amino-4-deoxy-L-arabinose transferase-like glycosyltransferase